MRSTKERRVLSVSPRRGRRGAALVLVMIFSVAALMLVSTLLVMADSSVRQARTRHELKVLQSVVRFGIAESVKEINRHRLEPGYADPTGNGFGCVLMGPDGEEGWPVRSSDGRLLGRYRSMIRIDESTGTRRTILSVVAVWPSFTDIRAAAAAEVDIRRGRPPFDRNALSIRGDADAGNKPGVYGFSNQVDIVDAAFLVPAVNISDPSTYDAFVANLNRFGTISGYGGAGSSTVTSVDAGILNQANLTRIAGGIDARVSSIMTSGRIIDPASVAAGAPLTGNYFVPSQMTIPSGTTLSGSGTLVIAAGVKVDGRLEWDGDVIVANRDGASTDVKGTMDVTGIMAVQGVGSASNMGVMVRHGGRLVVDGALTVLGNNGNSTLVGYESGARLRVVGIMTVLGNDLRMEFSPGAELSVQGSLALVTPTDSPTGVDVRFRQGAHMDLSFNDGSFERAVDLLGAFFDPEGTILPVSTPAYWEPAPAIVLRTQAEALENDIDRDEDYGMN